MVSTDGCVWVCVDGVNGWRPRMVGKCAPPGGQQGMACMHAHVCRPGAVHGGACLDPYARCMLSLHYC
eukprot:366293-Chlamydomonas_euryale.AAC.8